MELIQNGYGNFQLQKLREVIQTTMEISKVNISMRLIENDGGNFQRKNFGWYKWRRKFPKAQSGVDPKWPLKFPTSKFWLMQNDDWNFQRKHFESSLMTMEISNAQTLGDRRRSRKLPNSNMESSQNYFGNFQCQY